MLYGPMKEGNTTMDIDVPDIDPPCFLAVLRFLYTAKVSLAPESAMGTLYASKKYGIQGLSYACVKYLKSSLTKRNVCMMFAQAQLFDEKQLEIQCLRMIEKNTKDILDSAGFREMPAECLRSILGSDHLGVKEITIFRACLRWAECECKRQRLDFTKENKRIVMKGITSEIRFPLISSDQVVEEVVSSGVLTSEELVQLFSFLCSKPGKKYKLPFSSTPRIKFLIIGTDWAFEVKQMICSACPVLADAINPNVDQPTLAQCEKYDAVLVFSSSAFTESDELGDVLANYLEGGGGVVVAAIAGDSDSHGVGGRFEKSGYSALNRGQRTHNARHCLGKLVIPDHPILESVNTFDGGFQSWRVETTVSETGQLIAEWEDGFPLVAEKIINDRHCSVSLNMWPPSTSISKDGWETLTDGTHLIVNSLMYVANA
mmetsp:Transcript_31253/g.48437  ORF Transcript_31253/g.48437 Transcript_31253/m.48437 type:complete len:430 (-) Transcript_31253:40-1329(-)